MPDLPKPHVAVIGAGPAGLMAADVASAGGARVTVFERMPSPGRKFLMAGRGGLNLTHSEPHEAFMQRYGSRAGMLRQAIEAMPPTAVREWCSALGQETFVGSSGRVFPRAMKTSPLLRAWLRRLAQQNVEMRTRHRWLGWDEAGQSLFDKPGGPMSIAADATILAMGGGSWASLGSDAGWVTSVAAAGIEVAPLVPSNCGFTVSWSSVFRERFEGQPLKRIALRLGERAVTGEAIVTATGIEGGAIYAMSGQLRDAIAAEGTAVVAVDLRPDLTPEALARKLTAPRSKQSMSSFLRRTGLAPVAIGLLQEHAHGAARPLSAYAPAELAALIKSVPLRLEATAPIQRAISTAGGVTFDAIDRTYMLSNRPGTFVAGEMLDWEAPTGGYLLQACFATGAAAGHSAIAWLAARRT